MGNDVHAEALLTIVLTSFLSVAFVFIIKQVKKSPDDLIILVYSLTLFN